MGEVTTVVDSRVLEPLSRHLSAAREVADDALDLEPLGGAALVDLLMGRPGQDAALALAAVRLPRESCDRAQRSGSVPEGCRGVAGIVIGSVVDGVGHLDLLAVAEGARRTGWATALLRELEARFVARGATSVQAGASSWPYAWPGVDLRYSAALGLLVRRGYTQRDLILNMDVDLTSWSPPTARPQVVTAGVGPIAVRRAAAGDGDALDRFVAAEFTPTWRREAALALRATPPAVHLGVSADGQVLGFACHGVYRADWFGPLGVSAAARGSGLGEALLRRCLDDQVAAGFDRMEIGWIGPRDFYSRTVGARVGRVFAVLSRPLER